MKELDELLPVVSAGVATVCATTGSDRLVIGPVYPVSISTFERNRGNRDVQLMNRALSVNFNRPLLVSMSASYKWCLEKVRVLIGNYKIRIPPKA